MDVQDTRSAPLHAQEQITRFHDFFDKFYLATLLEQVRKGELFLSADFKKLSIFDPELAELLLREPEETLAAAELAVKEFDLPKKIERFHVRFRNYPQSSKMLIREVRTEHLRKMMWSEGTVRQKSDVRPHVISTRFECPSCGNVITVLQLERKYREPRTCGCGRKGKFKELSKEFIDAQGIVLEEATDDLDGGEQPKRINVLLKNDLVSPLNEKRTSPGSKIRISGWITEIPTTLKEGGKSTKFDWVFEANHVEAVEEDYLDIKISKQEEEQIKEIARDPHVFERLIGSIAPSIYGHEKTKEGLLLQFVGGVRKERGDQVSTRGDMHVLLVGDPGCGKCVAGKTKIMLKSGELKTIASCFEDFNVNVFAINELGLHFATKPLRFFRRKAPPELLKVVTRSGYEIIVTQEHPLFTTESAVIFSKEAHEFRPGDFIAVPSKLRVIGSLQKIPTDIVRTRANNRVKYRLPLYLNEDFARLLGYLVGDGYVRVRPTTGLISLTNSNFELLNDFERIVKNLFGLGISRRFKEKSKAWEYYVTSIELVRILQNIDPHIVKRSNGMRISQLIMKSPDDIVKNFLQALFECEANVRTDARVVEFTTKSRELAFEIKYVLLRFGIVCRLYSSRKCATNTERKIKRTYYRIQICGEQTIRFSEVIGFFSLEKRARLDSLVQSQRKINTNVNVIPGLKSLLKVLRNKYNLMQSSFGFARSTYQHYERGDRNPSYEKLRQICSAYQQFDDPLVRMLTTLSNADIFWDQIKLVKNVPSDDEYVYDLEIDRVHNFIANGIMVHNSQLLKRSVKVAPKARYVAGTGASAAGITASVVKDEFLGGWSLEAGALVLANKGFVMIDELDKMGKDDRAAMHEGLEQQSVSISKANIQATLRAETTVLAAANPKLGRFNPMEPLAPQIDLPPTLINRFDLIFPVKDMPDKVRDERMAKHILGLHQDPDQGKPTIPTELLRKYIAYARKTRPRIGDEAMDELKDFYVSMRNKNRDEASGMRAIPITARQLDGLVRLAEASAKVRLSDIVTRQDALRAIALLQYCLNEVARDETGQIDTDLVSTGISSSQRGRIIDVKGLIAELEGKIGKTIPMEDIIDAAQHRGMTKEQVEDVIEKLRKQGDIFEPKRGFVQRIT